MNLQHFTRSRQQHTGAALESGSLSTLASIGSQVSMARDLMARGQTERASAMAEAIAPFAPLDPDVLHLRGDCLLQMDQPAEAITLFDNALTISDTATLWAAKGAAFVALRRPRRAATCFERAAALAPKGQHEHALIDCLLQSGAPQDAMKVLSRHAGPFGTLKTQALAQLGQRQNAMQDAWAAAEHSPDALRHLSTLAQSATETEAARNRALSLANVTNAPLETLCHAARLAPDGLSSQALDRLTAYANDPTRPAHGKAKAHLALFYIFDANDHIDVAADHLRAHHQHAKAISSYKRSHDSAVFTILMRLRFTPLPQTKSSILPIFVTGLPGSGVTEAARVLQQGAQNNPARPLTVVEATMSRLMRVLQAEQRRDVTREDLLGVQSDLREGLAQAAQGTDVVVDCARMNFRWSGLIAAALPEARIVHMTRDHVQTGWATYRDDTINAALECRHDPSHLAAFLLRSATLMRHWEETHSNIFGVSGDALCRPGGKTARALLEYCGLNWSAHCRAPQYMPNRDWHRYATTVAPLRKALKTFSDTSPAQLPM